MRIVAIVLVVVLTTPSFAQDPLQLKELTFANSALEISGGALVDNKMLIVFGSIATFQRPKGF